MAPKAFKSCGNLAIRSRNLARNPYPGLRSFNQDEDWLFFGRDRQIFEILGILTKSTDFSETHFVTVIGPSGCGKSSLIRAGVLPALEKGAAPNAGSLWTSTIMRPGDAPFENLIKALLPKVIHSQNDTDSLTQLEKLQIKTRLSLGRDGLAAFLEMYPVAGSHSLVLLIDQFEELFSDDIPRDDKKNFVSLLVELFYKPLDNIYVILTMRSDYIGDCTRFIGLAEVINKTFYLIPRMTKNELREAIERPALSVGGRLESDLTVRLLDHVSGDSDDLPLIQHALMWMWLLAKGRQPRTDGSGTKQQKVVLGATDYKDPRVGGVSASLSNHGDYILSELKDKERDAAELLFRQLIARDKHRYIRNRTRVKDVIEISRPAPDRRPALTLEKLQGIINLFRHSDCSFIYTNTKEIREETLLDIGHEALIRQWKTLKDWARKETDLRQQLNSFIDKKKLIDARGGKYLDELEIETYRRIWKEKGEVYEWGTTEKKEGSNRWFPEWKKRPLLTVGRINLNNEYQREFPSEPWGLRYLKTYIDEEEGNKEKVFKKAREFWVECRQWIVISKRRKRLLKILGSIAVVLIAVSYLVINYYTKESKKVDLAENDLKHYIQFTAVQRKEIQNFSNENNKYFSNGGKVYESLLNRLDWFSKWWWKDRINNLQDVSKDVNVLFTNYADLYSITGEMIAGEIWRKLEIHDSWSGVPLGNALYFDSKDTGQCVAAVDALGKISILCENFETEKILLYSNLEKEYADCFLPESYLSKECKDVDTNLLFRMAQIAYQDKKEEFVIITGDKIIRRCSLSSLSQGEECKKLLQIKSRKYESRKYGVEDALRNIALSKEGTYLAAIYWNKEPEKGKDYGQEDLFSVKLIDLSSIDDNAELHNIRTTSDYTIMLDTRDGATLDTTNCGYPRDVKNLMLSQGKKQNVWQLTALFDGVNVCQWELSNEGPTIGAMKSFTKQRLPLRDIELLDISPSGKRSLVGSGRSVQRWYLDPKKGPISKGVVGHEHPLIDLNFLDEDRILSSSQDNKVYLSFFNKDTGQKQLLTEDRRILRFALGKADNPKYVYGIAHSEGSRQIDIMRWELSSKKASRFGVCSQENKQALNEKDICNELYLAKKHGEHLKKLSRDELSKGEGELFQPLSQELQEEDKYFKDPKEGYCLPSNRQLIMVNIEGDAHFFNTKPKAYLFTLTPGNDNDIRGKFNSSELFCQVNRGCWLELEFEMFEKEMFEKEMFEKEMFEKEMFEKKKTVVYHFPQVSKLLSGTESASCLDHFR